MFNSAVGVIVYVLILKMLEGDSTTFVKIYPVTAQHLLHRQLLQNQYDNR